jgi:hypothetical protein
VLALHGREVELAGAELVETFQPIGHRPAGNGGASPTPADESEPAIAQDPASAKRRQSYMSWRRAELVDELLRVREERDRFQEQWLDASDNLLQ